MSNDKPDKTPAFVFVDNPTERLLHLHRVAVASQVRGQTPEIESTAIGRGLNYVRADYVAANPDLGFGMTLVDPCKIHDGDVARVLHRCTSRQAITEWGRLEKRPAVVSQIKARLNRNTPAVDVDAEAN